MSLSRWIREIHRWLSIVFTAVVILTWILLARGGFPAWVSYLPLPPLFLLLFTGLYLFALPYAARGRRGRSMTDPQRTA